MGGGGVVFDTEMFPAPAACEKELREITYFPIEALEHKFKPCNKSNSPFFSSSLASLASLGTAAITMSSDSCLVTISALECGHANDLAPLFLSVVFFFFSSFFFLRQ